MRGLSLAVLALAGCATTGSGGRSGDPASDGRGYAEEGALPEAVVSLREARAGDPSMDGEYAYALAMAGLYEPALTVLERAIERDPRAAPPYYYAGWVFFFAGYPELGRDLWAVAEGDSDELDLKIRAAVEGINSIGVATTAHLDSERRQRLGYTGDSGVVVTSVYPGPPAVRGALQAGDVVFGVGQEKISAPADLSRALDHAEPGQSLTISVWRKGSTVAVQVPVASTRAAAAEAVAGPLPQPSQELLDRLDWADFLLLEHHPLQAALAYRRIIDRYPSWYLPYLNYSMALEEVGALRAATAAMRQAVALAETGAEEDLKGTLRDRLEALEGPGLRPADWRLAQRVAGLADAQIAAQTGGAHVGFAGGQVSFGSAVTMSATLQIGRLFASGLDLSGSLSGAVPGGVTFGVALFQRIYVPRATRRMSFNFGVQGAYTIDAPSPTLGPMVGLSFFVGEKRDRSVDLMAQASVLTNPMVITGTLGVTQFFGR